MLFPSLWYVGSAGGLGVTENFGRKARARRSGMSNPRNSMVFEAHRPWTDRAELGKVGHPSGGSRHGYCPGGDPPSSSSLRATFPVSSGRYKEAAQTPSAPAARPMRHLGTI